MPATETRDSESADSADRPSPEGPRAAWSQWYKSDGREYAGPGGPGPDFGPPPESERPERNKARRPRDPHAVGDGSFEGFLNRLFVPGSNDWAAVAHVGPLLSYVLPLPGSGILIAYLVWRFKRDTEPGVAEHGKEALNFQITLLPVTWVAYALFVVPGIAVSLAAITLMILASIRAAQGRSFRYPYTLRVVE